MCKFFKQVQQDQDGLMGFCAKSISHPPITPPPLPPPPFLPHHPKPPTSHSPPSLPFHHPSTPLHRLEPPLPLPHLHLALLHLNHMRRRRATVDILEQFLQGLVGALGFALDLFVAQIKKKEQEA